VTTNGESFDPRQFIAGVEWRFAKTMAHYNPHWYVVERDNRSDAFAAFVELIENGEVRMYRGHPYNHVTVDGWDYWLTRADDAGDIINRKPSDQAGWDDQAG
jgi:hypothetical protein